MKKIYLFLFIMIAAVSSNAQVVINEVYGGGGNAGATYKNDFIELYNNGSSAVSLAGWSVQYASAAGSTWTITTLSGSIAPGGYYLIQQALGAGGTLNLPTPDATGTIAMGAGAGKVALVNNTVALSGTCPTGAQIIDFVGFGTTANCFEGMAPTPVPSAANSVQRTPIGTDSDRNNIDFTAGAPTPSNSVGADIAGPLLTAVIPANTSTGLSSSFTAVATFNETVTKGSTGTISVKRLSDNVLIQSLDITTAGVIVSGTTVTFDVLGLSTNTGYYIEISSGAFKDNSGNLFAGITGSATWSFTTGATAVPTGILGNTYSFTTCLGLFPDGFSQYSVTGPQVWGCTTFGRDPGASSGTAPFPNGVQINGYDNNIPGNVLNQDWFISPSFDLIGTTYPLLSFWSRTRFNGAPLLLKVSTDYPGTGDPNLYTWTDLNGKFPAQASDIWTLSSEIDLAPYKSNSTYFAFVYNSSSDDGARWTLDDITVTNSLTPPPAVLTTNTTDLALGFTPTGSTAVKTLIVTGSNITGPITLTATGSFLISKTNGSFTSSVTYTQAEANNLPLSVYVQFSPTAASQYYTGSLTVNTPGTTDVVVNLTGNSLDPALTLEVVNWNIEWFGSTTLGPTNDAQQETNVKTITQNIGADLYALTEVVDETRLQNVVNHLNSVAGPGAYAYVISNFGSHTNPYDPAPSPLAEAQKQAFVYKTSVISIIGTPGALLTNGINTAEDVLNPAYNYFSSGRYPFMMNANVTLGGITKPVRFVLIHAKANTSPTATSYARRKAGSDLLNATLKADYPTDNILLLGDFNDDLDESITDGFTTTSYSAFTTDNANFFSPTLALSLAGKKSTVSYNDMIDHVELSNEMQVYYLANTASVLSDVTSLVSNYASTTTDHYPVFTRYAFDLLILPVKISAFTAQKTGNATKLTWTTEQEINSKEFAVERSTDGGRTWTIISVVPAAGNSSLKRQYNIVDNAPAKGINLYRLRSVDVDGKYSNSETRAVLFSNSDVVLITPNPASNFLNVYMSKNNNSISQIIVSDVNGKLMERINTPEQSYQVDLSRYSKGMYVIKVIGAENTTTQKVIIQ